MAHVILGLLMLAPQSLYDLIKSFEASVAHFYSSSSGSIKRALDSLLQRGLIEVASAEPTGRGRKVYRVTASGADQFRGWMTGELVGSDLETAALSRVFFLGLLNPDERVEVVARIRDRIDQEVDGLDRLDQQLGDVAPEGLAEVAAYQRATLDYGRASARFALDWFTGYLDRVRDEAAGSR